MSEPVLVYTLSVNLTQALKTTGNSVASAFAVTDCLPTAPSGDGVWAAGSPGMDCPSRILLTPYCDGATGSQFSFRVFGWRSLAHGEGLVSTLVWIPFLLAEFACTACNRGGFAGRLLKDSERLCDTISLTQGSLGPTGSLNSTGPGTDLVAWVLLELAGARFFSFDFQQTDPVGMNCLWSKV